MNGDVSMQAQERGHRFEAIGEVRLLGIKVGGQIFFTGAKFEAPEGKAALSLDGAEVAGAVFMEVQEGEGGHRFEASGEVHLIGIKIGAQLYCTGAKFEAHKDGSALSLDGAEVKGDVFLQAQTGGHRFEAKGDVRLLEIRVGGQISCVGAKFEAHEGGIAVSLDGAEVTGHVLLESEDGEGGHRFEAKGLVRLLGIKVGAQISCTGAKFEAHEGEVALFLEGAEVRGHVFLQAQDGVTGHRFEAIGEVVASGMRVGGQVGCVGAKFEAHAGGVALSMNHIEVGEWLLLRAQRQEEGPHRFEAHGTVRLTGARVGGELNLDGARLKAQGDALAGESMHVGDGLRMRDFAGHLFECDGTIRLSDTEIGGNLDCSGAMLNGGNSRALSMSRGKIGGDVRFCASAVDRPFIARGEILLAGGTTIRGRLDCSGAMFIHGSAEGKKRALSLWNLTVERDLRLRPGSGHRPYVDGQIYAYGLKVGGTLECLGLFLDHSDGDALFLDSAAISSDFVVSDAEGHAADIRGSINLSDSRIGGSFRCDQVRLGSTQSDICLDLTRASVTGAMVVRFDGERTDAQIRLIGARASELDDDGGSGWGDMPHHRPGGRLRGTLLELDGFTYSRLATARLANGVPVEQWQKRVAWLERQFPGETPQPHHFFPQPHEQLARALRLSGHGYDARRILLHKYAHESNCRADRWFFRSVTRLFSIFFGCGYLPGRALLTVLAWWAIGWALTVFAMTKPDILVRAANGVEIVRSLAEQDKPPMTPTFAPKLDRRVGEEIEYGVHPKLPTRDIRCHDIDPGLYALDTMLPVVDLHMEDKCEVSDDKITYRWVKALYAMIGWLIVALAALTWSGVLRRET